MAPRRDLERRIRADGVAYGVTTICAGRMQMLSGHPLLETLRITAEVVGATRVASVAQQFGAGSRVLVDGHLELREQTSVERLARVDGAGEVLVQVPCSELVLVIETIFNAASPAAAVEAQRQ